MLKNCQHWNTIKYLKTDSHIKPNHDAFKPHYTIRLSQKYLKYISGLHIYVGNMNNTKGHFIMFGGWKISGLNTHVGSEDL